MRKSKKKIRERRMSGQASGLIIKKKEISIQTFYEVTEILFQCYRAYF
jgi:hypothetical protein